MFPSALHRTEFPPLLPPSPSFSLPPPFLFLFSYVRLTPPVPLRFFHAFVLSLPFVSSFFLVYSVTHIRVCLRLVHTYIQTHAIACIIPLLALFLRVTTQWRCHTLSPIESNQYYCFIVPLLLWLLDGTSVTYRLMIFWYSLYATCRHAGLLEGGTTNRNTHDFHGKKIKLDRGSRNDIEIRVMSTPLSSQCLCLPGFADTIFSGLSPSKCKICRGDTIVRSRIKKCLAGSVGESQNIRAICER